MLKSLNCKQIYNTYLTPDTQPTMEERVSIIDIAQCFYAIKLATEISRNSIVVCPWKLHWIFKWKFHFFFILSFFLLATSTILIKSRRPITLIQNPFLLGYYMLFRKDVHSPSSFKKSSSEVSSPFYALRDANDINVVWNQISRYKSFSDIDKSTALQGTRVLQKRH